MTDDRVLAFKRLAAWSGADDYDIGHVSGDITRWWGWITWYKHNATFVAEDRSSAGEAAEDLSARILESVRSCPACGNPVSVDAQEEACVWRREGPVWVTGCTGSSP